MSEIDKIKDANAYILAGGKSSRMGVDKGLLLIQGKEMILYVIEVLQTVFENVIIVSNNSEYEKFGLKVIPDLILEKGPSGGIYTALTDSDKKKNFIVSCDMPFISKKAINFLIENQQDYQIIVPEKEGNLEPLFGLYKKECQEKWLQLIENNKIKLQNMVLNFNLKRIIVENNPVFEDDFFENINTKEDLTEVQKQLLQNQQSKISQNIYRF